ncbi:flagellar biosynthesis protein FlhA [Actinoplanes sp. SE50]|uniref:flagellar biosynthesis protein FlhA n=1 Tax=unclassified Actinoplanes TaxID=2626549 RepID=UPI00023EDEF2|nr:MULTISPECIES: flagellar biosynthesis protein FlhA [unclassified Actinoplanes]AEV88793.1 Flagellar biosynthesis protein flhA [Actinoplanes sp. SE50/110]ATO87199.1 flagellar biosynthesis protein FlhA [Actinoplanes sp. SE50]SLM04617.1 flagellar biosynthesis protein FlhA [Actinoplanes sp. SE50/110]
MKGRNLGKLAVPVGVIGIIIMMVVPLPTFLLDLFIAMNITMALLVLLISMFVEKPLDFAVFPALLLVMTLFRLALNISATRLVLRDGDAGKVIHAFGSFVVGGNLVIGLVIFSILVIVQLIVVTKGAERVAEVGARFTLDAMPGKQMAIDADLNAGLIDEDGAKRRRAEVAAEAEFYGAMDGGSKFVKGDAIAAIIITLINLIGGFAVGILQHGLAPADAMNQYSMLSIGDGLVSQVPALLLSVATGLIVTRSATSGDMGQTVTAQLSQNKLALRIGGAAALALCVIPGLPKVPFLVVGVTVLAIAQRVKEQIPEETAPIAEAVEMPAADSPEQLLGEMRIDPLELALAPDLVDLVDASSGDLLDRVRALRRKMALELGVIMPPVRTRDDLDLPLSSYAIRISGVDAGAGQAPPGTVLAIGEGLQALPGRAGVEPVFGLAGKWVPAEMHYQAELSGATVVDRASVIITHLAEIVRNNASRLLGREDVRALTEMVKRTHPVVVEELTPGLLSLGQIQKVLQAMLDEGVPIRDLVRIFEALSLRAKTSADHDGLVEAARAALGPAIAAQYASGGRLTVITLDPMLEQSLLESLRPSDTGAFMAIDGMRAEAIVSEASRLAEAAEQQGLNPVLACSPQLRLPLMRLLRAGSRRVQVLSYSEISGSTAQIETIGVVNGAYAGAA